jgi:gamma-glutamyltranspeptidase/glutathione hydrolase
MHALRSGGNAFDAAISALAMSGVCEPLLTGLGGGGLAMLRVADSSGVHREVLDFFTNVPGLGQPDPSAAGMEGVLVDFGPDKQLFKRGEGSVGVPGTVGAIHDLHQRYATLPLSVLLAPAVRAAREGLEVSVGLHRSILLLWPIIRDDPTLHDLFGLDDAPAPPGKRYAIPALADTLERFGAEGPEFLISGIGAQALLNRVAKDSRLTARDLQEYRTEIRTPMTGNYRSAGVNVPGVPSQAGAMVLRMLQELESCGPLPAPLTAPHIERLARAMEATDAARGPDHIDRFFDEGFLEGWLAPSFTGFTTHLSTADEHGNAIGVTSSLGETAGFIVEETGVIPNNFLGEEDVNPERLSRPHGARLLTMCCPTIVEHSEGFLVMGSGGSSRIRTALMQGIVGLMDHGMSLQEMADLARCHFEDGVLRVESVNRPQGWLAPLEDSFGEVIVFDEPGLFFGGLHMAGQAGGELIGAGDARRSGTFAIHDS